MKEDKISDKFNNEEIVLVITKAKDYQAVYFRSEHVDEGWVNFGFALEVPLSGILYMLPDMYLDQNCINTLAGAIKRGIKDE